MNLVIVESPAKGKTIEKFLGPDYRVLSSYGHVRDLPEGEFGVDIKNDFKPKYIIIPRARKNIQLLKKASKEAREVILATDEDREGEAIAFHLAEVLNLDREKGGKKSNSPSGKEKPTIQRVTFNEITKPAIEKAFKTPRQIDINLVFSQQTRRILDRIVGYKLSPFLWRKVARGLSAGRVQSVTVRFVVEREREIKNFIPEEYWTIEALLNGKGTGEGKNGFKAILAKKDGENIPKLGIKTKKEADKIIRDLKKAEYKVIKINKKEIKRNPFPPFATSTLQQEAWQRFRFPAKMTMRIAQQLYEKGHITYHRTDSLNLSDLSLFSAKKFIIGEYGKEYWAGFLRRFKSKGRVQEAHEAIRPTYSEKAPEKLKIQAKLDDNQYRLYDLIWRRFIASQMAQAIFDSTIVEIEAKNYIFRTTGQILKFDGFLKIYPIKYTEAELPQLKVNEILELIKLIPSQHFTQPPPRYTEATLIKVLEENGIGRPSTYAPILSTIQERNYVAKDESKRFYPTEIGLRVNDILVNNFSKIVDIGFTAKMEENLDRIASAKENWVKVLKDFYDPFSENLKKRNKEVSKKDFSTETTSEICPECKSPLVIRISKYGRFYGCSAFPKCKYKRDIPQSLGIKCPKCKDGEIIKKGLKNKKFFYGCSNYPKCDFALWDKPTGETCPKCNSALLARNKWGKIYCSNKDCEYNAKYFRKNQEK